jgi:hypothetical protein
MKYSIGKQLTAGTETEVFTVPNGLVAEVSLLFISNHTGNNKAVDAIWQYGEDPTRRIYIIDSYVLNANGFVQFSNGILVMQQGDSLRITPDAASSMSVIVTFDLHRQQPITTFD